MIKMKPYFYLYKYKWKMKYKVNYRKNTKVSQHCLLTFFLAHIGKFMLRKISEGFGCKNKSTTYLIKLLYGGCYPNLCCQ